MNRHRKYLALRVATAASAFVAGVFVHAVVSDDSDVEAAALASEAVASPAGEERAAGVVDADETSTPLDTALALATAPQTWLYLDDTELERQVRAIAAATSTDALADEVLGEVGAVRDALLSSPGRVWWIVRPLAWRVDSESERRAQVSVWTVSVLSAADVAMPQSEWQTTTFDLVLEEGEWRLVDTRETPGPSPQLGGRDSFWKPERFDDALDGFTRVGEEPVS